MLQRRQLFQFAGVATVAAAGGAAWMYYGWPRSGALAGGPFRHYPFDPVAAELAGVGRKRGQIQPLEGHRQIGAIAVIHGLDLAEHMHGQIAVQAPVQNPGRQRIDA